MQTAHRELKNIDSARLEQIVTGVGPLVRRGMRDDGDRGAGRICDFQLAHQGNFEPLMGVT